MSSSASTAGSPANTDRAMLAASIAIAMIAIVALIFSVYYIRRARRSNFLASQASSAGSNAVDIEAGRGHHKFHHARRHRHRQMTEKEPVSFGSLSNSESSKSSLSITKPPAALCSDSTASLGKKTRRSESPDTRPSISSEMVYARSTPSPLSPWSKVKAKHSKSPSLQRSTPPLPPPPSIAPASLTERLKIKICEMEETVRELEQSIAMSSSSADHSDKEDQITALKVNIAHYKGRLQTEIIRRDQRRDRADLHASLD